MSEVIVIQETSTSNPAGAPILTNRASPMSPSGASATARQDLHRSEDGSMAA
jgi:hypothetical protein